MHDLDRMGRFRVEPTEWSVREAPSGAVGVGISFLVIEEWDTDQEEWRDWREFEPYRVRGTWWVVKRDGSISQNGVDQLSSTFGWDGTLETIRQSGKPRGRAQVQVTPDEYRGKTEFRAEWLHGWDADPTSSAGGVNEARGKELDTRFGSLLRAAASGAPKPAAPKPGAPPPPSGGDEKSIADPDDDLPF